MSLFAEMKRRNVFRVALAYIVLAWLVLQVADVLVQALELPAVWNKGVVALLVLGIIPTLVFAWVYELTPEGIKRESEIDRSESITDVTAHRLNIAVLIMGSLAIALFAWDRFRAAPVPVEITDDAARTPAGAEEPAADSMPVVAVLPLQAVSAEEEGRFLASGLHDDLLTRLARLEAFRVISRTSVMEYADTTKNLREIGRELGAGFIVEGGLQAIGGRVRIDAQLIDARTDEHLWAETFERPLTSANLFDVQGEIAAAIAEATHATLSPSDRAVLEEVPTENLAAYEAYLSGNERIATLTRPDMHATVAAYEKAVALDPDFVDAWANLALARIRLYWEEGGESGTGPDPQLREQAQAALARARSLAPERTSVLLAAAYVHYYGYRDYASALVELGKAAAAAPNHFHVRNLRAYLLRRLGRMDDAADILLASIRREPNLSALYRETPNTLIRANRCGEALDVSRAGLQRFPDNSGVLGAAAWGLIACEHDLESAAELARRIEVTTLAELRIRTFTLALAGDIGGVIDTLTGLDDAFEDDPVSRLVANDDLAWAYRQAGNDAAAAAALAEANAAAAQIDVAGYGILAERAFNAALNGDRKQALEFGRQALAATPEDAMIEPDLRFLVASAWSVAGLHDEAVALIEENRDDVSQAIWSTLPYDPFFAPLHGHERWDSLFP